MKHFRILFLLMATLIGRGAALAQVAKIGETAYQTLADAVDAVPHNNVETTIVLIADALCSSYIDIQLNENVVIDLQSHTIKRSLTSATALGHVIQVSEGGTLTIKDTSAEHAGKVTGGWSTGDGGGIINQSTLILKDVAVTGNTSAGKGGGIFCSAKATTLTIEGGAVTDNTSAGDGGGIYSSSSATLTIEGGSVSNNEAATNGGGIHIAGGNNNSIANCTIQGNKTTVNSNGFGAGIYVGGGTVTVAGCTINSNIGQNQGGGVFVNAGTVTITNTQINGNSAYANATGGGIYLNGGTLTIDGGEIKGNICTKSDNKGTGLYYNGGTLNIKGQVEVSGNYWDSNPTKTNNQYLPSGTVTTNYGNIYLPTGKKITVTGSLSGSQIGVTLQTQTNVFTSGLEGYGDETCFTSDKTNLVVGLNSSHEAILGSPVTLTFNANGGTGTMDSKTIATNSYCTLPECTFTHSVATMAFDSWNTKADGSGTDYAGNAFAGPFSAATTLYAQWYNTNSSQAAIGDTQYETLQQAINAVTTGGATPTTITLLRHVTNGDALTISGSKNLTIDFGGYTYDVGGSSTDALGIGSGSTVTLTNGTLTAGSATTTINNSGNLTLTGMNVTGTIAYSDQDAAITITSGTYDITWSVASALADAAKTGINISGGTFTAAVPQDYCAENYLPKDNGNGTYTVYLPNYVCQNTDTGNKYDTLQEAVSAAGTGETIIMLTNASSTSLITIPAGKNITIDLKGKTVSRSLSAATNNGHVIKVASGATLTIQDTSGGKGKITGGWTNGSDSKGSGGGINNDGVLTLKNITVTGNKAAGYGGGGIYSSGNSTITIEDCEISNNEATVKGGGIHISSNNPSTLTNCVIKGNKTTQATNGYGAGLFIQRGPKTIDGCTFTENDGQNSGAGIYIDFDKGTSTVVTIINTTVSNNTSIADGAGIYLNNGELQMSGLVNIAGNTKGGTANNLYLPTGKQVTVTGTLNASTRIGVTLQTVTDVFTIGLPGNGDEACFTSDDATYTVGLNASGEAVLGVPITLSFNANGGTGTMADIVFANGTAATLPACAFTPSASGLGFTGWNTAADGSGTTYSAGAAVSFSENTTLYAQWEYQAMVNGVKYLTLREAVEAVEANGQTPTTITLLRDVSDGEGIALWASAPKNIVIDFDGHSYNVSQNLVGSTGTQNQAFHLERGSTVVMQNGTLTSSTASMLIQNYCDLTLTDMNVGQATDHYSYAVSNNCGSLTVDGSTSITAAQGQVAFDVCVTNYYPDGVSVNINTTGTITGVIKYDVWGSLPPTNNTSLTITGGNFNITWDVDLLLTEDATDKINISGGTFASAVPEEYCATGYIPLDNGNGTYTVTTEPDYVCRNKGTGKRYATLTAGIASCKNAATDDEKTVVMIDDETIGSSGIAPATNGFILDLNDHTITGNLALYTTAMCVITDNGAEGQGKITNSGSACVSINGGATLDIQGGTIEGNSFEAIDVEDGTLNVTGGTISGSNKNAIVVYGDGVANINGGVVRAFQQTIQNDGTCIVNGGTITATAYAILNTTNGYTTINGGTITSTGTGNYYAIYNNPTTKKVSAHLRIYGGTIESKGSSDIYSTDSVRIYGGTFNGQFHANSVRSASHGLVYKIYGGANSARFKNYDYNIHCGILSADSTLSAQPIDGYYRIVAREVMCKIGEREFRSIDTAIKSENEGEIIKVVRDVDDGHGILLSDAIKGLHIVIDFDGHTYEAVTRSVGSGDESRNTWSQVLHYSNDNTLTIKNGTLKVKDGQGAYFLMFMQNYSDLTIEDMTIDATNLTTYNDNLFNFRSGSSVIKGKTKMLFNDLVTEAEKTNGAMTLNMGGISGSYPNGAILRIDGNEVEILGNFTVRADNATNGKDAGLSINGGYFKDFVIQELVDKSKVAISGGTYAANSDFITSDRPIDDFCIEEYCACDHRQAKGDRPETWTVRWPVPELTSAGAYSAYDRSEDKDVTSAYYTRTINKSVDKYQCWFVPFDYEVTQDEADDGYEFYNITSTSGLGNSTLISLSKLDVGETLEANKPYVIKTSTGGLHGFASPYSKTLKAVNRDAVLSLEGDETNFSFYGIYQRTYATAKDEWLTVSIEGTSFWSNKGDDVKPFRWIIKPTDSTTGAPAKVDFTFVETEGSDAETTGIRDTELSTASSHEVEGIYTVNGVKTEHLRKGINIIKTKGAKTKVVIVK